MLGFAGVLEGDAFNVGGMADVNLEVLASFGGSANFPSLRANFGLDWEYQLGDDLRSVVDARFHRNLMTLIKKKRGPLWPIRRVVAWWYWRAVYLAGDKYFGPSRR